MPIKLHHVYQGHHLCVECTMPSCAALVAAGSVVPPSVVVITPIESPYQMRSGKKRAHPLRRLTRLAMPASGQVLRREAWRVWGVSAPDAPDAPEHREVSVTFYGHTTITVSPDDNVNAAVPGDLIFARFDNGHLVSVSETAFASALGGNNRNAARIINLLAATDMDVVRSLLLGHVIRKRPRSLDVFVHTEHSENV